MFPTLRRPRPGDLKRLSAGQFWFKIPSKRIGAPFEDDDDATGVGGDASGADEAAAAVTGFADNGVGRISRCRRNEPCRRCDPYTYLLGLYRRRQLLFVLFEPSGAEPSRHDFKLDFFL